MLINQTKIQITVIILASWSPKSSNCFFNGVFSEIWLVMFWWMSPIAVLEPVLTTTAWPLPLATVVPEKRILIWSCLIAFSSFTTTSASFETAILSPVRIDWSTLNDDEETSTKRQSAGTLSPEANETISPGTRSSDGIFETTPLRITLASSGVYSFKAYFTFIVNL